MCMHMCMCVYVCRKRKGGYYKKLAHAIMEAVKFHDLHLENWRSRRADDIVPVQKLVGSRPKKNLCFSPSPKAGKDPAQGSCAGGVSSYS